jgi:phosphatidylglycerol lysyltransferase
MARLLEPAAHEVVEPDAADLDAAGAIIAAHSSPTANLVYLRDKAVLFDADRKGFLMYGVQGRTWVALGDPVGPPERMAGLIRQFLERCDDFAGVPVFYEVSKDNLHQYADFGLAFVKLGEEARVDLTAFTLEGGRGARFRQVTRRLEKDGGTFRVIPAAEVAAVVEQLREVLRRLAQRKVGRGKGILARLLRRRVSVTFSGGGGRTARADRGVRQPVDRCGWHGAVARSHALPPRCARETSWKRCSCT